MGLHPIDLSGAARIAPLFLGYTNDQFESVRAAVRQQTAMTHADPHVVDAADFFAYVTFQILGGAPVTKAVEDAVDREYPSLPARQWLNRARSHVDDDPVQAITQLGQTCHIPDAFPSTLLLLLKYPDDVEMALIENVMAGGDSAARGLLLGMVLGARNGYSAIPTRWINGLQATPRIESLIKTFGAPLTKQGERARETRKVTFSNSDGITLDARLEFPAEKPRAYALFAHCFTGSDNQWNENSG